MAFPGIGKIARIVLRNNPYIRTITTILDLIQIWMRLRGSIRNGYKIPGYTLATTCSGGADINWQAAAGAAGSCLLLQAGGSPLGTEYTTPPLTITLAKRYFTPPSAYRWDSRLIFTRNVGTVEFQQPVIEKVPYQRIVKFSWLQWPGAQLIPDFIPPNIGFEPAPLPWNQARKAPFAPEWKYQGRHKEAKKQQRGRINLRPYEVPSVNTEVSVKTNPDGSHKITVKKNPQAVHRLAKPRPNEREAKLSGKTGIFYHAVSKYGMEPTEWLDFLDAIYQALPENIQGEFSGSVHDRIRGIFDHWDKLDWEQVIENLILNELEDMGYGKLNRWLDQKGIDSMGDHEYYELRKRLGEIFRGIENIG